MKQILLLLSTLFVVPTIQAQQFSKNPFFKWIKTENTLIDINPEINYDFGYLEVPENRSNPASKHIQLPVFVFKSRSKAPKKDPIIYLVGGPGSSIVGNAPYMKYYQYLDDRDFILLEQRGTRYARPHLDCPEWKEALRVSMLNAEKGLNEDSIFLAAAKQCKDRLVNQNIDLNGYTTDETAADVEALRRALALEKYNLLTLSYGTKIAQILMRDYPNPIRSVVLDSPLPLQVAYDEESVTNLLQVFETIFQDCEKDSNCQKAYPNLQKRFYAFLEDITVNPLEIKVKDPISKMNVPFKLQGKDIIRLLPMSSTYDFPKIPSLVSTIIDGDLSFIRQQIQKLLENPGNGAGLGMRISVWCAEETPFASPEKIQQEMTKYSFIRGIRPTVIPPKICDFWSVQPLPQTANQAIQSAIPTLIFSGSYDPDTPTHWGKALHEQLENSFHIIFDRFGHTPTTFWEYPCGMRLANAFFNAPKKMPESDCFTDLPKKPFVLK